MEQRLHAAVHIRWMWTVLLRCRPAQAACARARHRCRRNAQLNGVWAASTELAVQVQAVDVLRDGRIEQDDVGQSMQVTDLQFLLRVLVPGLPLCPPSLQDDRSAPCSLRQKRKRQEQGQEGRQEEEKRVSDETLPAQTEQ